MTTKNLTTATEEQTEYTRCACHAFEIESWKGDVPEDGDPNDYVIYEGTDCTQMTYRTYAPGHDAKLKSLLIKAGAAGLEVVRHDGGVNSHASAEKFAQHLGFGHQVLAGIARAKAKAAERAEKKAAKAAKKAEPKAPRSQAQQVAPAKIKIKIGRHFYDAVISPETKEAAYVTAKGEAKTAPEGKYKLADAA